MGNSQPFTEAYVKSSDRFYDVSSFLGDDVFLDQESGELGTFNNLDVVIEPSDYFAVCIICGVDPAPDIVRGV